MKTRARLLLTCFLIVLAGCGGKKAKPLSTTISKETQSAFEQFAADAVLTVSYVSSDRAATKRVFAVNSKLSSAAGKEYRSVLMMDGPQVGTAAIPANHVFISEPIVSVLKSDSELAAVIAHEIGHLAANHSFEKLKHVDLGSGNTGLLLLANWEPANTSAETRTQLTALAARIWTLAYTREEEQTAQQFASSLLQKSGFDSKASASAREHIASLGSRSNYLTQHPSGN